MRAFELAVETILECKARFMWLESEAVHRLQAFLTFYLNLICDNVVAVNTNSSSEIFEQLIRIG